LTGNNFLVFTNHTYKGRWRHVFELVKGLGLHRRGLYFLNICEMNGSHRLSLLKDTSFEIAL